jgi:hypothetical protein
LTFHFIEVPYSFFRFFLKINQACQQFRKHLPFHISN